MMLLLMMMVSWFVCDYEKEKEFISHITKQ